MYKICSQFLIVLSCVMLMVVSLQVDYVMIACILTGIIVCTFIDMQDVPQSQQLFQTYLPSYFYNNWLTVVMHHIHCNYIPLIYVVAKNSICSF